MACWTLVLGLSLALTTTAQAQANKKKNAKIDDVDTSKSGYVLPYTTLALCIALGIIVVCLPPRRSGSRTDDGGL